MVLSGRRSSSWMSFHLSFHLTLLGPTGAYWLDDPFDLSCKDSTQQYPVDDPPLSCKQQVGGSSPPASSQNGRSQAVSVASGGDSAEEMSSSVACRAAGAPAPLRYVGVPPASPLAGVRTLDEGIPLETGSPRPAGR